MRCPLIVTFLLLTLVLNAQDFRYSKWGESLPQVKASEQIELTELTSDFEIFGIEKWASTDKVAGITTEVTFIFLDGELAGGVYNFDIGVNDADNVVRDPSLFEITKQKIDQEYPLIDSTLERKYGSGEKKYSDTGMLTTTRFVGNTKISHSKNSQNIYEIIHDLSYNSTDHYDKIELRIEEYIEEIRRLEEQKL